MIAVFKREFRSFFNTPIGYVVMAILFAFSGYFFYMYNLRSGSTNLTSVYTNLFSIVVLVVLPILTMRSFSEEKRQKTDQALLTSPVSLTGIVVGKFLAAVALFALSLGITLVYAVVIATKAVPDWPVVFGNYVGMMLLAPHRKSVYRRDPDLYVLVRADAHRHRRDLRGGNAVARRSDLVPVGVHPLHGLHAGYCVL